VESCSRLLRVWNFQAVTLSLNCMPKWLFSNQFAFGPTGSIMAALFFVLQHVLVKLKITTCMKLSSNQFCSLPLFAVVIQ
jgi:hypothetical protein